MSEGKNIDDSKSALPCLPMQDGFSGMTLREYYAGQALQGLCANGSAGVIPMSANARDAVALADALIAALKVTP